MSQSVADFLGKLPRFEATITGEDGHTYAVRTSQVAVTTASSRVVASDPTRVSWTLCNFGAGQAYVSWTAPALVNRDFPIFANGGVLETSQIDDKNVARMPLYVIGDAASTLAVIEVVRVD